MGDSSLRLTYTALTGLLSSRDIDGILRKFRNQLPWCDPGWATGELSHAGVFSFYPTKVLGGYGDGGMVITDDESLAAKLRRLRFYHVRG